MDNQEYERLEQHIQQGLAVSVTDQFLFEREQQRRAQPPNILQQQIAARQQNPLLQPQSWYMRMGAARERRAAKAKQGE